MPELPEVETVKRGLDKLIIGKTIVSVKNDTSKSFPNDESAVTEFFIGAKIVRLSRRAKVLLIELSTDYTVMIHLKMTGQVVFVGSKNTSNAASGENRWGAGHPNDSLIGTLPDKSTRVTIEFSDTSRLYFNDQRKFGWMKLLPNELVSEEPFMQKVGPEPLESGFSKDVFINRLRKRTGSMIKAALLDQTVVAGVGNIYADEALWAARIHPCKRVQSLSKKQLEKLHTELIHILKLAIEKGGSTDRNYVNAEGKKGSYISIARVFRREGQPCPRCKQDIEKIRVAGRGTHVCLRCQKA